MMNYSKTLFYAQLGSAAVRD